MEKYKKKVQKRTIILSLVIIGLAVIYFLFPVYLDAPFRMSEFISGFRAGAFAGVELVMVYFVVKYFVSTRKEELLRKLYIEENDERTKMIMQKSGALGMGICMVGLAAGTVVAGYLDQTVFFSLLGALVFTSLVRAFIKVYYHLKI